MQITVHRDEQLTNDFSKKGVPMPLRDHFRPPLSERRSWEEIHGGWPMAIVQQLTRILPPQYMAGPRVHLGSQAEVDVATFEEQEHDSTFRQIDQSPSGATAWAPALPTLVVETGLADFDEYEVRVYEDSRKRRLVAAIELLSPGNKDRPGSRYQFVAKCAALLRQHVALVLVDVVGVRNFNLYAELLELIGEHDPALREMPSAMYAVACRWRPRDSSHWLETWNQSLEFEKPLPTLPLWLNDELAVPLDLETSYEQTCRDLRII